MYSFLDKFFYLFHSSLMIFILGGWIWQKTRLANLVVILLTSFSWFFLGIWYGFGFCPSTEWHWQVRMKLGHFDMPDSYTKFLVDSLTGWDISQKMVDVFAVLFLMLALTASVWTNVRDWKRKG
ncbi:MAG: DUF2784 family protein [Candidatus Aminicenantes bacterium]